MSLHFTTKLNIFIHDKKSFNGRLEVIFLLVLHMLWKIIYLPLVLSSWYKLISFSFTDSVHLYIVEYSYIFSLYISLTLKMPTVTISYTFPKPTSTIQHSVSGFECSLIITYWSNTLLSQFLACPRMNVRIAKSVKQKWKNTTHFIFEWHPHHTHTNPYSKIIVLYANMR